MYALLLCFFLKDECVYTLLVYSSKYKIKHLFKILLLCFLTNFYEHAFFCIVMFVSPLGGAVLKQMSQQPVSV